MSGLEKLRILSFVKKTKLLKNGDAPIFVRITIDNERCEWAIKKSVLLKHWNEKEQRVKPNAPNANEINTLLNQLEKRIHTIAEYLAFENQKITSRLILDKIQEKKETRRTILKIFDEHNKNAKQLMGVDFAQGTIQRYETSYMHTKDFIKWKYKREDLALEELNQQFVKDYELYLKTVRHCNHNSATKYLKNFKKITRIALANQWMENDPFATIKFKLKPVDAIYLTRQELNTIINKEIGIERIDIVKDVFLFCCFTGLAFSDVKS